MKATTPVNWQSLMQMAKGCATDEEQQQVAAWIKADPEQHRPILDHITEVYQGRGAYEAVLQERILKRVAEALPEILPVAPQVKPMETPDRKWRLPALRKWAIAVSIALIVLVVAGRQEQIRNLIGAGAHKALWKTVVTGYGQEAAVMLPDGSAVRLAPGSRLRYPEHFAGKERQVQLTGAAFFDVRKNPAQPFTVMTGKLFTKVLGTSFEVVAYPDELQSTVTLITGKVMVHNRDRQNNWQAIACLTPNKKLTLENKAATFSIDSISIRTSQDIKNGKLVFENSTMAEIAIGLKRKYNIHARFKEGCRPSKHISATFDQSMSLEDISLVLGKVSGLHITTGKDSMYISY
ncbi:FecR family protein [Taibaiella koreensis]|uniref:FecR family protein n=1 Tax=Taibaiella koreensis TaxID=1268548 RepID=UPI000E599DEE|nr:FecR family protein [Taibaiella koreensis]